MIQKRTDSYQSGRSGPADRSLQYVLWTLWTLAVVATALYRWYADISAGRALDVVGLVIYTALAGLAGLLVMTLVELRADPERFLD